MDVMQYAELFQAEAGEYMQVLNQCLLNLEKNPADREDLLEAFRVVHSLKGMAGTMGYQHVTDIAHGLESFMEDFKTAGRDPAPEVLDLLFAAVDLLQLSLEHPEEASEEDRARWQELLEKMNAYRCPLEEDPSGADSADGEEQGGEKLALGVMDREILRQAVGRGAHSYLTQISLKKEALMKSVRVYMIMKAFEECSEVVMTSPPRSELEEENFDYTFQVLTCIREEDLPGLENKLSAISDLDSYTFQPWEEEQAEGTGAGEPLDKQGETGPVIPVEEEQPLRLDRPQAPSLVDEESRVAKAVDKVVRVETQKLDDLVNLVGEMVVARTRIAEIGHGFSDELDTTIDQLKRSIGELQDTAMGLRMVPIKQVFERFPRMMRDLCREKGKKVRLNISGEDTELDRSIINSLSDPLVHLLRNAFDHGIESPEERVAKGKQEEGVILLQAHHEGNQVVITVEDDGAGINPRRVGESAVHKGVISAGEMAQLSRDELMNLIFYNGFSTSEEVTEVSGRGVGMDAVRKSIEALHGSVEVSSEEGVMTRFVLRLPLTLAIIKVLLVQAREQLYAIPVEIIRENVYLGSREIRTIRGNPVVNLRGDVVPLYMLSSLLGFDHDLTPGGDCSVVIVEAANRRAGFIVDDLVGQQEIMIKSLGEMGRTIKGIAGAAILGDGRVTLIVDVPGLLSEGRDYLE